MPTSGNTFRIGAVGVEGVPHDASERWMSCVLGVSPWFYSLGEDLCNCREWQLPITCRLRISQTYNYALPHSCPILMDIWWN